MSQPSTVVFVAFQEQDNLGVGYIASVLLGAGYRVKVVDFRVGRARILEEIRNCDPLAVGISIIFQYHLFEFRDLVRALREAGVSCHISAGGHYPSLRFRELLGMIPELDTVVRFEGEWTFLELVRALDAGADWRGIEGLAYLDGDDIVTAPARPLERDLDRFPPPLRRPLREYALGRRFATLLAGRGCVYDCTFCSIREFYSTPPGPVKRLRRPEMVVREMELLHEEMDCWIYMFQDDDFPVSGRRGRAWAEAFCHGLEQTGLADKVMWKINCRPDEIDGEVFDRLRRHGLFLVYLGIESGTDEGLRLMNKRTDVAANHRGVERLKRLGIEYDYGFMLFDPSSTFASVRANLDFLERLCGDGSSPVTFCKMLPYAETRVESELRAAGRLKGGIGFQDYDLLDPALDRMLPFVVDTFKTWIGTHNGVLNLARWARHHLAVREKFEEGGPEPERYRDPIRALIADSNRFLLDRLRGICDLYQDAGAETSPDPRRLELIRSDVAATHARYQARLARLVDQVTGGRIAA